jgi:hypothetical protein
VWRDGWRGNLGAGGHQSNGASDRAVEALPTPKAGAAAPRPSAMVLSPERHQLMGERWLLVEQVRNNTECGHADRKLALRRRFDQERRQRHAAARRKTAQSLLAGILRRELGRGQPYLRRAWFSSERAPSRARLASHWRAPARGCPCSKLTSCDFSPLARQANQLNEV